MSLRFFSSDPATGPKRPALATSYSDKDTITFMRDRIKSLEAEMKYAKGQSDVWRNKAKMALEAEEYLLSQISDASEQLLGELFLRAPGPFSFMHFSKLCLDTSFSLV